MTNDEILNALKHKSAEEMHTLLGGLQWEKGKELARLFANTHRRNGEISDNARADLYSENCGR